MFCPKCAAQNLDGASFCRVCGANISLVPQALSGQLVEPQEESSLCGGKPSKRRRELTLESAFKNAFMGIGFLFVAIALAFSIGRFWWFWMLIPAFSLMGTGIAQYIRVRERESKAFPKTGFVQPVIQPPPAVAGFVPRRNTGELVAPPPSVTEGTTRHLGAEAQTRHLDASNEFQK
jgi:hypothetical protein